MKIAVYGKRPVAYPDADSDERYEWNEERNNIMAAYRINQLAFLNKLIYNKHSHQPIGSK